MMWSNGSSHSLLVGTQSGTATATLEDSVAVSYKAKYTITIQFSIYAIYPSEMKTCVNTQVMCTWMFVTALFITVKIWKQLESSMNKLW